MAIVIPVNLQPVLVALAAQQQAVSDALAAQQQAVSDALAAQQQAVSAELSQGNQVVTGALSEQQQAVTGALDNQQQTIEQQLQALAAKSAVKSVQRGEVFLQSSTMSEVNISAVDLNKAVLITTEVRGGSMTGTMLSDSQIRFRTGSFSGGGSANMGWQVIEYE